MLLNPATRISITPRPYMPAGTVLAVDFTKAMTDHSPSAHTVSLRGSASRNNTTGLVGVNVNSGATAPDSADWLFPADFTVEWWGDYDGSSLSTFVQQWVTSGNQRAWSMSTYNIGSEYTSFVSNDGAYPSNSADGELVRSSALRTSLLGLGECHQALTRSGNNLRLFFAGSVVASATLSIGSLKDSTGLLEMGAHSGYCKAVRIVKGVALYTGTFTPPGSVYEPVTP